MSIGSSRAHGQAAQIWVQKVNLDPRGNRIVSVDMTEDPIELKAAFIPDRASRAEVPGQQEVEVVNMLVDPNLEGVGMWSRVFAMGKWWDTSAPPQFHNGPSKRTRHWTIPLRRRPNVGPGPGEVNP